MGIMSSAQDSFKKGSTNIFLLSLKVLSGLVFSFVLALIGQGLMMYGNIAYWLVLVTFFCVFLRMTRNLNLGGIFILDLILVLVGIVLRMYVLVAPNL